MSDSLRLQTLALIGQEFLLNALANGSSLDSAMANMLLRPQARSGREVAATALTGRVRSDAATLRQSAKNAAEGATMASMIKDAAFAMGETLSKMHTVVQTLKQTPATLPEAETTFANLARSLSGIISGTRYNGISLLDKSGWATDERVTTSGTGETGTVALHMNGAQSTLTLRDLSDLDFSTLSLAALNPGNGDLDALLADISTAVGKLTTMSSGYESLAGAYTAEARYFENQADLLAATAERALGASRKSDGISGETVQSILMDLMLRDQGKIVDTSS